MFHGLLIPERSGHLALRADPSMPENQRAKLLSSAAVSGPGVKLDGTQGRSWPVFGQAVPQEYPADPANAIIAPYNHNWDPLPTGGYGSWSFAFPVIPNGAGVKIPVSHTLNPRTWVHQSHSADNRYENFEASNPEYADMLAYDHLGIVVSSTGHDESNLVSVLSSLMIADYNFRGFSAGQSFREGHSNYWYDISPGQFLSKEVRAKTSSAFRIRPWSRCYPTPGGGSGSGSAVGNVHPVTGVPMEGEDIPPSTGPITGDPDNIFPGGYAISLQFGDGRSNFTEENWQGKPVELVGGRGFLHFGDMNFRGLDTIPIGRPNNVAFWDFGPPFWGSHGEDHGPGGMGITPFSAQASFLASGPIMFSARKHRIDFKENEYDIRSAAISTRAYYWDGMDENQSQVGHYMMSGNLAVNPHTGETLEVAEVKAGPIAFEPFDWPWPKEGGFWHQCQFYFNPFEDHHYHCAPDGVKKQGGQWHVVARLDLTSIDDPVETPISDDPSLPWGPITGDKKIIVDGKLQLDGTYIQPRANSNRPSEFTRERQFTPIPLDRSQANWIQNGDLDHGFGDQTIDRLAQPVVLAELSGSAGTYTTQPEFDIQDNGDAVILKGYRAGTGPGFKVFAPPEVRDYQMWNDSSFPLPSTMSDSKVVLLNNDDASVELWLGVPKSDGKVRAGLGLDLDGFTRTDDSGDADHSGKTLKIGAYTIPMSDGAANQVLSTNGSGVASWGDPAGGTSIPVGTIWQYGVPGTLPTGWLECDGGVCPDVELRTLLSAAGDPYGDSGGTPLLPNLIQRSPEGWENGTNTLGGTRGESEHTLSEAEMFPHTHGLTAHSHTIPVTNSEEGGHTHFDNGEHVAAAVQEQEASGSVPTSNDGGGNTDETGGGDPFNVVGPRIVLRFMIYGGASN